MVGDLPEFDAARDLDSDDAIAKYLTAVIEQNDPALLAAALTEIASAAGLTREALYKALRRDAQPRFDIISRVALRRVSGWSLNRRGAISVAINSVEALVDLDCHAVRYRARLRTAAREIGGAPD